MNLGVSLAESFQTIEGEIGAEMKPDRHPQYMSEAELVNYLAQWGVTFDPITGNWARTSKVVIAEEARDGS